MVKPAPLPWVPRHDGTEGRKTTVGEYQGWTNYETWAVKLWLDNEQATYSDVTSHANTRPERYEFSDWLRDYVEETLCSDAPESGLSADLFRSAWQDVNWSEIAQAYLDDVEDGEDEDEDA